MRSLRFAVFGCGFWARYQLAGWREAGGAKLVGLYNRTLSKAHGLADECGLPRSACFDDPEMLLRTVRPDFVDIITSVETHAPLSALAAGHGTAAICQKPMAPDVAAARRMHATAEAAGAPLLIHENWRWQTPVRAFHAALANPALGACFRARVTFSCSFPVFDNQPFLRDLPQFILTDIGSHVLDTARFLFGDARTLFARTRRVNPTIRGEDVATVLMETHRGVTVTCEMSYASRLEHERFPETYVLAECEHGSVELGPDYWIRTTTREGTVARRCPPARYAWADPAYDVVHASIVDCNRNLLAGLTGAGVAETASGDNLKTVELVHAAYASAAEARAITLGGD